MRTAELGHTKLPLSHASPKWWCYFKQVKYTYWYLCAVFAVCFAVLQIAFFLGIRAEQQQQMMHSVLALENRISLDIAHIPLPNPQLNQAGNARQVSWYLHNLNEKLAGQHFPLRVASLQGISPFGESDPRFSETLQRTIRGPEQTLTLALQLQPVRFVETWSLLPAIVALLITLLCQRVLLRARPNKVAAPSAKPSSRLIMDLEHKCLRLQDTDYQVELANKPLCFYTALIEYCAKYPTARLCQHLPFPEELLAMADQYYLRLVALGHPIRRRPDFEANPEKMLSEIRAALDELFAQAPELKANFYPPKALGEGSRSKLHNFALTDLGQALWRVQGL